MPSPATARETASVHHLKNALPEHPDNPGMPFDPEPVAAVRVNLSAVKRRAATMPGRRTVKKEWQAAWLLRRHRAHRPHHPFGRRYQGRVSGSAPRRGAASRRPAGGARPRQSPHRRRRGLRLPPLVATARRRSTGSAFRRRGLHGFSRRARPVRDANSARSRPWWPPAPTRSTR